MTSLMLIGAGIAVAAFGSRALIRSFRSIQKQASVISKSPMFSSTYYYKGGFDPNMTRREALLILGVSPSSSKERVQQAYKRIMVLNHPDQGGSPYLSAKISQAKQLLDSGK